MVSRNQTNIDKSNYDGILLWNWCQGSITIMTVCSGYIFVCMVIFVRRSHRTSSDKFRARNELKQVSSTYTEQLDRIGRETNSGLTRFEKGSDSKTRNTYKRLMNYLCLWATLSILLKLWLDQVKFFYAWNARSDYVCEVIYDVTDIILFALVFLGIFGFLWLKQWIFYSNPAVEGLLYHKFIIIFSRVSVVVIMFISAGLVVANTLPVRYKAGNSTASMGDSIALSVDRSYTGCVSVYDMTNPEESWPLLTYAAVAAFFQSTLLGLFIYPLVRERIDEYQLRKRRLEVMKRSRDRAQSTSQTNWLESFTEQKPRSVSVITAEGFSEFCIQADKNGQNDKSYIKITQSTQEVCKGNTRCSSDLQFPRKKDRAVSKKSLKSIRRAVVWTAICAVTDTTLVAVFAGIGVGTPQILTAAVTDLDLFLNIICLVATYSRWKEILLPFRFHRTIKISAPPCPVNYKTYK